MRSGMMGMSFEDTLQFFALKVEICFKKSVASVAVKSLASHTVPFQKAMVVSAAKVGGSSEHCWR